MKLTDKDACLRELESIFPMCIGSFGCTCLVVFKHTPLKDAVLRVQKAFEAPVTRFSNSIAANHDF